ncbi:hypothetical protein F751_5173 [Auxenochlorella protothecoides]|uniref:Protein FAM33A n=2 Tax=Auxenochlorella protothecoides TaxID=3075 RepID=A0A087SQQ8_AUXPR|nr:hypothetical protein F751_5173 [Auxenochlorella protothecoides]KFM28062.1 hypothetical protein F751_5173 [Auxenochlorella protothecoides]RMZ54093.1 hypothetical protein APUTEX25_002670 [Auxenochlorella protothecoides]|eukprot:RMZ54093.1 hypothetical protein APUTEX25_002670 [Auxenochlorella protothecoides]
MVSLREGSESLTSSLLQAQAELDQIGHRLEQEFSSRYRDSEVNPLVVLNRLHKLRRDISAVAEDAEDLAGTRDTLAAELSGLLASNVAKLHALQRKAGIHPSLELPGVPA